MNILGYNIIELFVFVLVMGIASARFSSLVIKEDSFLWTGYIIRYIFGIRYERRISDDALGEDWDIKEFPQTLGFIKTIKMAKNNGLDIYVAKHTNYFSQIISCIYCFSYWLGVIIVTPLIIINISEITVIDILYSLFLMSAISGVAVSFYKRYL